VTDRRARLHVALLAAILVAGAVLRFAGLDWDQGQHLHPDERFLTMVATSIGPPASIAEYLDTARSPANPANVGHPFFVYGTLPVFLARAVAGALHAASYERLTLVGRALSALFDCGTILLTWLLGRRLGGPRLGLAAAALVAFSVPSIQNAHFFTVDAAASFFAAAALFALLRVAGGGAARDHAAFGVAFGLALACRSNLAGLGVAYVLAVAYAVWKRKRAAREALGGVAVGVVVAAVVLRVAYPYAFAGPGILDVAPDPRAVESLRSVGAMVAGDVHFPPALQWIGRAPVLYPARNLFLWNMGPAWGLAALAGAAWLLFRGRRAGVEPGARDLGLLALLWTAAHFLFHASQFAATARYFLPLVPCFAVFAAWPLARGGRARSAALAVLVAATGAWALAFTAVYRTEHTRVRASRWIYEHVPPGATLAGEDWDDALPLRVGGLAPGRYRTITLHVYDDESGRKWSQILDALAETDYVVLSSQRGYGSVPRDPWRYPVTRRFYELLLSEALGFRRLQSFTSYPALGPLVVADEAAEEAFTVYDHPPVLVFARTAGFSRERAGALLAAAPGGAARAPTPREASRLYRTQWPTSLTWDPAPAPAHGMRGPPQGSLVASLRWIAGLEASAAAAFALMWPWLRPSRDRGYALAKTAAWLAPAFLVFGACSLGLAPVTTAGLRAAAAASWAAGAVAAWRRRRELAALARARGAEWLTAEAVFAAAFLLFALLRALNPAIFWGEKPMDFGILNALYRTRSLPPVDPWMAGETLRYSWFGQWLVAAHGQITGVEPALAFNLGIATTGALLATGAYAAGRALGGRRSGLAAAAATVVVGNLAGVRLAAAGPGRVLDFHFFWATSRVVPGTINEFPFWSLAFGDLHAHLLALPFDAAVVAAAALWLRGGLARRGALATALLVGWFAGASVAASTWNLPVVLLAPAAFLVTAWRRARGRESAARAVLLLALAVVSGGVLYLPVRGMYQAVRPALGRVRDAASLADVLTIFGLLLLATVPALAAAARPRHARSLAAVAALAAVVVAMALRLSPSAALFAAVALVAVAAWWSDGRRRVTSAAVLVALATAVVFLTETVYVSDRMNTVFKYSLHAWLWLAVAAGVLLPCALASEAAAARAVRRDLAAIGLVCGLFTSAAAATGLLRDPRARSSGPTLDGLRYLRESHPDEEEAYRWLREQVAGSPVILEAEGPPYGPFARVSMNTGLPTVLGWDHHLRQREHEGAEIEARRRDVRALFESADAGAARALALRRGIALFFVGPLERATYSSAGLAKLEDVAEVVFRNREVTVYALPGTLESTGAWSDTR
jgi:YYY domain-containing protein